MRRIINDRRRILKCRTRFAPKNEARGEKGGVERKDLVAADLPESSILEYVESADLPRTHGI